MKKYLLLVAAAASILAVSCNREEELRGPDSQKAKVHAIDDSTPMPVVFTSQYVATKAPTIATKGLGAIDDWYGARQQLYVFGYPYKRVEKGVKSYEWIDYSKPLMENVAADAPTANSDSEGIRLGGSQRAKINVYNENAVGESGDPTDPATWEGLAAMEPYYYREDNALGEPEAFSFFAYFVDDAIADPTPTVTHKGSAPVFNEDGSLLTAPTDYGNIVLPGLVLDGTQDIMLATTNKEVDALARSRYLDKETYQTLELTDDDLGEYVEASRIYSAHAARRGINPDLVFEHQLSRITFHIRKGGTVPSSDITMAGIDLFDYYEGTLTIADGQSGLGGERGLAPVNTNTSLTGLDFDFTAAWQNELQNLEDGSYTAYDPELAKFIKTVRKADDINTAVSKEDGIHPYKYDDGHYDKFGQSVLVFPGREKLDMILKIEQVGATAVGYRPYKTHLEIKNDPDANGQPVLFEAGKNYNVYLTVYGLEEVRISVTLTEWDDAAIYLDPDQDDDDMREAAQILLGTDRSTDPEGIISNVGAPVSAAYEDENCAYLPYENTSVIPHGELTIRECDSFDLLSTKMFVKGDPNAATPTVDHYEDVLAYVRSNSNGEFHFSIEGVVPTYNNSGLRVYENAYVILVEDGKIEAKDVTPAGTPVAITVRQNSSNDFLAAIPRVIDLTIAEDDRVPVIINWNDKTGVDPAEEAITILNEEGASATLDMNATFTIGYDKDGDPSNDVTYVLTYTNIGTVPDPVDGWGAIGKISGDPKCGRDVTPEDLTTAELAAYIPFDLKFEVTEGKDVIRIDPKTGVITALAGGDAKVKVYLSNLANDDTYQPTQKEISVKVVLPQVVISNFPAELTIKYGEKYTFKPVVSNGASTISYESATPATVEVGAANGIIFGKAVGGPVNVTITVADGHFYTGNTATCAVTVVEADPVVTVNSITIDATDVDVAHVDGAYPVGGYTVEAPKYAGEGIAAYAGAITYESTDTGVFTVDADGKLTGVAAGRATLKVILAADTHYNAKTALVTVNVKAVANTFDLHAAESVVVDANGNGDVVVYSTADGEVTLNAVTKGGSPVPSFGAKFSVDQVNKKIVLTGVADGSYELTLRAAGDAKHLAATSKITLTVTH